MQSKYSKKFSVVLAVCFYDKLIFLKQSILSLLSQTIKPDEIIIVTSGKIDNKISLYLKKIAEEYKYIKLVKSEIHLTPGQARSLAISHTKYDLIGIMDSDDISRKDRFEKEIKAIYQFNADVVGGVISEFHHVINDLNRYRRVPKYHSEILKFAKFRSPVNHVTIFFKKTAYLRSGPYKNINFVEDYDLIIRMIETGSKFHNLTDILVDVRIKDVTSRRAGIDYFNAEFLLFKEMYKKQFINKYEYMFNIAIRYIARIIPSFMQHILYKFFLR
jgi:glycosyltransferase involved in cell wall biosynthesis